MDSSRVRARNGKIATVLSGAHLQPALSTRRTSCVHGMCCCYRRMMVTHRSSSPSARNVTRVARTTPLTAPAPLPQLNTLPLTRELAKHSPSFHECLVWHEEGGCTVLIAGTEAPLVELPPRMLDLEPAASMAGRRGIAPPCARRGRHL